MSINSDEVARLRKAFDQIYPDDTPQADCPDSETIMDGVRGRLPREEFKRLVQHVAACPLCGESWQMAWKLEKSASRAFWLKRAAAIAAAALVVVVGYQQLATLLNPPQDPGTRSGPVPQLELLSGLGPYPRQAFQLLWTEFEGASYDLIITSAESSIQVQQTGLAEPEYLVAEANLEGIPQGAQLDVYIEVHLRGRGPAPRTFNVLLE